MEPPPKWRFSKVVVWGNVERWSILAHTSYKLQSPGENHLNWKTRNWPNLNWQCGKHQGNFGFSCCFCQVHNPIRYKGRPGAKDFLFILMWDTTALFLCTSNRLGNERDCGWRTTCNLSYECSEAFSIGICLLNTMFFCSLPGCINRASRYESNRHSIGLCDGNWFLFSRSRRNSSLK